MRGNTNLFSIKITKHIMPHCRIDISKHLQTWRISYRIYLYTYSALILFAIVDFGIILRHKNNLESISTDIVREIKNGKPKPVARIKEINKTLFN